MKSCREQYVTVEAFLEVDEDDYESTCRLEND